MSTIYFQNLELFPNCATYSAQDLQITAVITAIIITISVIEDRQNYFLFSWETLKIYTSQSNIPRAKVARLHIFYKTTVVVTKK